MSIEQPRKNNREWFQNTTSMTPSSEGRSLDEYEKDLGFRKEELRGKIVLDLGSGRTERVAKEIQEQGIDATVISLNPDYKDARHRRPVVGSPGWDKMSIAALGQALPFKDESFDEVLALYSVSWYMDTNFGDVLREIYRVLTPGGIGRVAPFYADRLPKNFERAAQSILRTAELRWEEFDPYSDEAPLLRLTIKKPVVK